MKRSEINKVYQQASLCFKKNGWHLPPNPKWDVTDFGLGDFANYGLVLVNLCEEIEYCEKLMYAQKNMHTPAHYHKKKKEDIICRMGVFVIQVWDKDMNIESTEVEVKINNELKKVRSGSIITLHSGERITLFQNVMHEFWSDSEECIIGEVSTANDDLNDNFFKNPDIGRYPHIDENEKSLIILLSDKL